MTELTFTTTETDYDYPSLKEPGWALIHVIGPCQTDAYKWDIDCHNYDGSAFWIQEGIGFDYFIDKYVDIPGSGYWVIEGIVGTYYRGDGWTTDDDEDWEYERVRAATEEEIERGYVIHA